ncbi:50S ribosomal protein L29 [Cytophagaceae bacterium ABcell3]|nr:50S ribosomal protein L29 [Cytophagaceae bacterium ABcell3]
MKNSEIKSLSIEDLKEKLAEEQESLVKLKFAHAISPIENPMKLKQSRKLIARYKTEIRAKEINS